jgi:hypothetical protein
MQLAEAERLVALLPPPRSDPISGVEGPLFDAWTLR